MDFYNTFIVFQAGTPYANPRIAYFPFAGVPFYLISFLPARLVLISMLALFVAAVAGLLYRALDFLPRYERLTTTAILSFLSYPFLFGVDRANIECLLFALLCGFFVAYRRNYLKISVGFLACATAMKLYPGVFVVLFLARKQYKAALGTIALTSLLTVVGAAVSQGGILSSFHGLRHNLREFKEYFILTDVGLHFNSSYFGLIKIGIKAFHTLPPENVSRLLLPYTAACLGAFALLSVYIVYCEKSFWKQVAILSFAMILFPEQSFDYKLIHILFPLAFFVRSAAHERRDVAYSVLFGLLMIPKAFFWLKDDISISVILNPLLMTLMLLLIVKNGVSEWSQGRSTQSRSVPAKLATPARV